MAIAVQNLTDRDLETLWDGVPYLLPAKGREVFDDVVARQVEKAHNRRQYPEDGKGPSPITQVKLIPVTAKYVDVDEVREPEFKHDDGSVFKTLPELLDYTKRQALDEARAQLVAATPPAPTGRSAK